MEIALSKKTILHLFVFLWIVFSVAYIAWDIWTDFKNVRMTQAYEQGRTDIIKTLIQEAEKCQPFSVYSEEKEIELIKTDCLVESMEESML